MCAGTPTGTVSFFNGVTLLGTVSIFDGLAIYDTNILALGSHNITAQYNGNVNFSPSTSLPITQNVNQSSVTLTTATSLTSTLNPSVYGENVQFNINVMPITGSGIPTGVVTLYSGATPLVTLPLVSGMASYSTGDLPAGNLAIVALYSGDSNFSSSTTTLEQMVNRIATTSVLSSSSISSTIFQPVTFTLQVSAATGVPMGVVSFYDGTILLGNSMLNSSGIADFTTSNLSTGNHIINATFNGSQNFQASSDSLTQVITQATTESAILSSSPNPSLFGGSVTFTAAISSDSGIPTGMVNFFDGATQIGSQSLFNGLAVLNISTLTSGSHNIIVTYGGSANFSTSSSTGFTQVVNAPLFVTNTVITSSHNPSYAGNNITFTMNVTSTATGTPTGTLGIYDGTTLIGTQVLVGGSALFSTASLAIGTHVLTAIYSGDSTFAGSISSELSQVVQQATTSTILTSSINPTQFGQATLLTASIAVTNGAGSPSGTVDFYDGSTFIGSVVVSGSTASLSLSSLSQGIHNLTAIYNGDATFLESTSNILFQTVSTANTTIAISSSLNPAELNEPITFTASIQVSVGAGLPTGNVTFFDGSTVLGSAVLSSGQAIFTTSLLGFGSHSITAAYNGDSNFAGSISSILTQAITQGSSTTTLTTNINPSIFGQTIDLSATIVPALATGTVSFYDGPILLGSAAINSGMATFSTSLLSVSAHSLSAVYNGDTTYANSSSLLYTQYVVPVSTTINLNGLPNPSLYGNDVTFTAKVVAQVGASIPIGLVSFREGSTILGSVSLSSGVATFTTADLAPGTHLITAIYLGSNNFLTSTSAQDSQIVQQGTTATTIASSLNPSSFGDEITLTAVVSPVTGAGIPMGSVTFYDGSTPIGTSCICGGVATLSTSDLSVGTHPLKAVYNGDGFFTGSTSDILNQAVAQGTSAINIVSAAPNPSMLGQNVTFFAAVTASDGTATGTVSFFDGIILLGTEPVYDGLAIFEINTLALGNHTITATYNGSTSFPPATSSPVIQMVNRNNITVTSVTTLTSNLNPSNYGEEVTFDIAVIPLTGPGIPTGVVTLYSGSIPIVTLNLVNGFASYTTDDLPAGISTLVALYSGDAAFSSSTGTLSQTVLAIPSMITLNSSINPSMVYEPVTFTAQVSVGTGLPEGTVSFYDGSVLLGTSLLNATGLASLTTNELTTGSHIIKAVYNGSQNFQSTSTSLTQVVGLASTMTTVLLSSPNPSDVNEIVTFIATVSSPEGLPTGIVTVFDGKRAIGSGVLVNGLTVINKALLKPGSHNITAVYAGSGNFNPSSSTIYVQIVNQPLANTTISLRSSKNPAEYSQSVVFTAKVRSNSSAPTGNVTFYDGSMSIGTSLLVKGVAKLSTSTLAIGKHPITAIYSGDSTYNPFTSSHLTQVIIASTVPPRPQNFYGCQSVDKYLNVNRVVNVLTWTPPETDIEIVGYEIYRDASLKARIGVVKNQCPYRFEDGNRSRNGSTSYYIVSVSAQGVRSAAASTVVTPKNTSRFALEMRICPHVL